jgi:hypothetical protein
MCTCHEELVIFSVSYKESKFLGKKLAFIQFWFVIETIENFSVSTEWDAVKDFLVSFWPWVTYGY